MSSIMNCGCYERPFTPIFIPEFGDYLNSAGDHVPLFYKITADMVKNLTAIQIHPASDYDSMFIVPAAANFGGRPMLVSKEAPLVGRWEAQELIAVPQRIAFDNITPQLVFHPTTVGGASFSRTPRSFTGMGLILHHATQPPPIPSRRAPKFYGGDAWIDNTVADPGRFVAIVPAAGRKRIYWQFSFNGGTAPFGVSLRAYMLPGVPINPDTREAQNPLTSGYASIPLETNNTGAGPWPVGMTDTAPLRRRTILMPSHVPDATYATGADAWAENPSGMLVGIRAFISSGAAANNVLLSWTAEVHDE